MIVKAQYDLSIPLRFNGPQPNAYGVEPAISEPVRAGELVGDTRLGGSVNFERYTFIPHCNGTHTECVGHITDERIAVRDCLQDVLIPAVLISVEPIAEAALNGDLVISRESIAAALELHNVNLDGSALIVRTLPNDPRKLYRVYGTEDPGAVPVPPYFTADAMHLIVESGVKHLLTDLPSIDRIFDEGRLENHRIFWNVEAGSRAISEKSRVNSTITELIYVPEEIPDETYTLNLQIAPFQTDAAPSRPILLPGRDY
jgi:arylformamidase